MIIIIIYFIYSKISEILLIILIFIISVTGFLIHKYINSCTKNDKQLICEIKVSYLVKVN